MGHRRSLKRISVLLPAAFVMTLSHAQQEGPAKEKAAEKISGPSQAEMAKRQREIEEIEAAKAKQHQAGTLHEILTPVTPPATIPGTLGNTSAPMKKPVAGSDPGTKPKTEPDPDKLGLGAPPPK